MKKHESFLRKSNKKSSKSLSSLNDFNDFNDLKDEDIESEEFDMINWLKEIGFNENGELETELIEFPMTSIRNISKRYQDTITRRLSTIKNRKIKRNSQRADVRDIFKINDLSTENPNDDKTLSVSLSVENLDDKNAVEVQKRNLSLPIIDLDKEKEIEKATKFKSTSVNQLDNVKKELDNNKLIKSISNNKQKSDYLGKKQEINKTMHLDWPNKMKILYNLKDQLPTKNYQNYHLIGHKFKSGESICESDTVEPKINKRRSSWWFNSDKRKDSAVEIISLKQHSLKDSQIQHFVCHLSDHSSDKDLTCGGIQSSSNKVDFNQNLITTSDKSSEDLDGFVDVQPNFDTCFQVLEDEDENGLKIVKLINGYKSDDYIDQLKLIHQHKLRQYLMLELTLLLDINGFKVEKLMSKHKITQKFFGKNKDKKQTNQKNLLFGESLDELLNKDRNRLEWKFNIPIIFKILIDYIRFNGMDSEGIFRIPASNIRIQNLNDELKKLYSSYFTYQLGSEVLISFVYELLNQFSIYDVVAIFKQLIRELPNPLLNFNLQEIFLIVPEIQNFTHKIQILNLLVLLLNQTHRSTLKEILNLLKDVSKNKELNKMSLSNIALIIAPTLFSCPLTNEKKDKQMARTKNTCEVTKLIINYNEILFNIPDFILNQVNNTTNF